MPLTLGCVGCGHMGGAILAGLAHKGTCALCGYNRSPERMRPLEDMGVRRMATALDVARAADVLLVAVKPRQVDAVLRELCPVLDSSTVLVSVAAGIPMASLKAAVGQACPVVRCMPNTPAVVGKGAFALCLDDPALSDQQKADVRSLFAQCGMCVELAESQFTAFSALMGAGPAYVFGVMQGLVQAGVTLGFPQDKARRMVTALFEGCAVMAASDTAPLMQLRDDVCSPGGLTIAGVNVLDRAGLNGLLVEAVMAAAARGKEMESEG